MWDIRDFPDWACRDISVLLLPHLCSTLALFKTPGDFSAWPVARNTMLIWKGWGWVDLVCMSGFQVADPKVFMSLGRKLIIWS